MYRDSCGQTLNRLVQGILVVTLMVTLLVLLGNPLCAEDTFPLSSGTAAANGSATWNQALAGSGPSAVTWTLTYPTPNAVSVSASAGAALMAARKTLICYGAPGTCVCAVSAMNAGAISNGSGTVRNPIMAAGPTTAATGMGNSVEPSPAGNGAAVFSTGGTVTGDAVLPTVASLSCLPATLNNSSSSNYAASLSHSTNPALISPASVRVSATATSDGTFRTALSAAYRSTSTNAGISGVGLVPVSSRECNQVFEQPAAWLSCWQCYLLADQPS
jgi:hypothetical protein